MAVRTDQLALGQISAASSEQTVYTVPAGHTTILKDLRGSNRAASSASLFIIIRSGATSRIIAGTGSVPSGGFWSIADNPWIVLEAGDELRLLADVATSFTFVVSGAELLGDA